MLLILITENIQLSIFCSLFSRHSK